MDTRTESIAIEDYPTKALRPKNSRLSKISLDEAGFKRLPTWQNALDRYLNETMEVSEMRLLVTGGAGFIGTNFIYRMLANHPDVEIIYLDTLTYAGNMHNLDWAMEDRRFRFIKGDISKWDEVTLALKQDYDAVINFAAESYVDKSIEDPGIFLVSNIIGTQVLMDACRRFDIERFHQISTDEVCGDLPLERPDLLFTEQTPIKPSSPYSASKASADLLVQAYHRSYGLKTTIGRSSSNYKPYQFPRN